MATVEELSVKIIGTVHEIRVGQLVSLTNEGEESELGHYGDLAEVIFIDRSKNSFESNIYIRRRGGPHSRWEAAGGMTGPNCGLKMCVVEYAVMFTLYKDSEPKGKMTVNRDLMFKRTNLKGKSCKILARLNSNNVFVEMEEDVGGGSCDGLGKGGHCVPIEQEFLTKIKNGKKTKGGSK